MGGVDDVTALDDKEIGAEDACVKMVAFVELAVFVKEASVDAGLFETVIPLGIAVVEVAAVVAVTLGDAVAAAAAAVFAAF